MTRTLPVIHDAGTFQLTSFRDRTGGEMPVHETETRIARIVDGLRGCAHVRWMSAAAAQPQAMDVVGRVHAREYVQFLTDASARPGAPLLDPHFAEPGVEPDTPVTPGAWAAALGACASAVTAANLLTRGAPQAYAVCRPPGHHAGRAFMGGYCYLNNACVAAWVLRDAGKRVAVVDVDHHHGNGTADILRTERDIPFISLHAGTLGTFPYVATQPHADHQHFVPFDESPSEEAYLDALAAQLAPLADAEATDAIVISLGYDLVAGDPHGSWQMRPSFFGRLARCFRATGRQLCIVQEGGYALDQLAACAHAFAMGLD
jgi:acetoin utilization deacetylase AcuC-like enzyme